MSSHAEKRRLKSRALVRRNYHDRGWRSPARRYEDLLTGVLTGVESVLDLGCGRGFPMAGLLSQVAARVEGLDPTAAPVEGMPNVGVARGSADRMPYEDASFDVVACRSVLEHLPRPEDVFGEVRRVLKPGGRFVFLTPSKYDYVSVFALIVPSALHGRILKRLEGREEADSFPTRYRANSARQLRQLAGRTGFAVERLEYANHYPYLLTFSPLLCRAAIVYDRLICRFKALQALQSSILGLLRKDRAGSARKER